MEYSENQDRQEAPRPKVRYQKRKEPSDATLARWMETGKARATDGCRVHELDGFCEHGKPSWLIELGMI